MCENQSPAVRGRPALQPAPGNSPRAGFTPAQPLGHQPLNTGTSAGTSALSGWPGAISWDDFTERAGRPQGVSEDAEISYHMNLSYAWVSEHGQYRLNNISIRVSVDKEESWVVKGRSNDALLSHEQGHYDIAGLCYRDMFRQLRVLRTNSRLALMREINRITRAANNRAQQLNNQYDSDTGHNTNEKRQRAWKQRIQGCIANGTPMQPPD